MICIVTFWKQTILLVCFLIINIKFISCQYFYLIDRDTVNIDGTYLNEIIKDKYSRSIIFYDEIYPDLNFLKKIYPST